MRALLIVVLLLIHSVCAAEQHRILPENAAWTYGFFALTLGDYYVTHREWPSTMEQVRLHTVRRMARHVPAGERKDFDKPLRSFTHVEFKPRGKNLLVIARFRSDGREFRYDAIFHPGRSAEEIADVMRRNEI